MTSAPRTDARDAALLVDALPSGLMLVGPDGRVRRANPACEALACAAAGGLTGRRLADLLPESAPALAWLAGDGPPAGSWEMLCPFGHPHRAGPCMVTITPLCDGEERLLVVAARDASAETAAKEALADSDERLRLAVESNRDGVWDWHVPSGAVAFSDRWCEMLGMRREDVAPDVSSWERLVHPDDMPQVMSRLTDHLEGRSDVYACEHRMRHASGRWIWVLDRGRVVERDAAGTPVRAVGTHTDITARRDAELALKASEERLRSLFDAMAEGVIMLAGDGAFVFCNPAAERILGVPWEEIVRRDAFDPRWGPVRTDGTPFPGEEHPASVTLATGRPVRDVVMGVLVPDTDARRWISISSQPVGEPRPAGRPPAVLVTFADVTERLEARRALAAERDFVQAVQEAMGDGLAVVSPGGEILQVNERLCQLTGLGREDLVGSRAPFAFWPGRDEDGGPPRETALVARDGTAVPVIVSRRPLTGPAGDSLGEVAVFTDISERVAAEEALARSEESFRLMAENSSDLILRVAPDWTIRYASPAMTGMLGFSPQAPPHSPSEVFHPDDMEALRAAHVRVLAGEEAVRTTFRPRRSPGGHLAWVESVASPVRDRTGAVVEAQVSIRDITERVLREREEGALRRISQAVASGVEPQETFSLIARESGMLLEADAVAVLRFEPTADVVVGRWFRAGPPSTGDAYGLGGRLEDGGVVSSVRVRGHLWGCVSVVMPESGLPGRAQERLDRFARLAALAIDAAEARTQLLVRAEYDQRFRAALAGSPTSVFMLGEDLRFAWVYNTWPGAPADTVGRTPEEVLGDGGALVEAAAASALAGGAGRRLGVVRAAHGDVVVKLDVRVEPIMGPDGRPAGVIGTATDVSR